MQLNYKPTELRRLAMTANRSGPWSRLHHRIGQLYSRVPRIWQYTLGLFIVAKVALLVCGYIGLVVLQPGYQQLPHSSFETQVDASKQAVSDNRLVSMWYSWDAFIYQGLAKSSYRAPVPEAVKLEIKHHNIQALAKGNAFGIGANLNRFAFAPLYPVTSKIVGKLLGGHYSLALLVVSNLSFLAILYYAYRLGEHWFGDEEGAERFTKYIVLMPAAFILQAAMSEALTLFLILASVYYALKSRWALAGVAGFFAALSHANAFLLALPLFLILLQQHNYKFGRAEIKEYLKKLPYIALVPFAWFLFMIYGKLMTGDLFAFTFLSSGWGIKLSDPATTLWYGLHQPAYVAIRAWFGAVMLAAVVVGYKILKLPLFVYSLLFIGIAFSLGPIESFTSSPRYLLPLFPVALVFAQWARSKRVDTYLTLSLGILQGVFFVLWVNYWTTFII